MAESISISLTDIQNMLVKIDSFWICNKLHKLKSKLIQIQQSTNYILLQNISIDECKTLQKLTNDIRQFANDVDNKLDEININIESYERWVNSNIPNIIKILGITYHECKFLHNFRSLIDFIENTKFVESQNFKIKEGNELQIFSPHIDHEPNNFLDDFEKFISLLDFNSRHLFADLINKNNKETIIEIDLSRHYVYAKAIYDFISIERHFQYVAWVFVLHNSKRIIVYRDILKQLLGYDKKNDVIGLMSMSEDELQKELKKILTSYKCFILLIFDQSVYDQDLVYQFNNPMRSKLLVITNEENLNCNHEVSYGWELLRSIIRKYHNFEKDIDELKTTGLELIKKCHGVPRQIIRIGGVLRENVSIHHWTMVLKSLSYHNYSDGHWKIVALTYDNLSFRLKECFLYFGQFWKGIDICTEMLYQMWMAEGIITTMNEAEESLGMLARMLLIDIQESEFSTSRWFVSCRIDNFVKKFCLHPDDFDATVMSYQVVENTSFGLKSSSRDGLRLSMKFDIYSQELNEDGIEDTLKSASKKLRSLLMMKDNRIPRIKISFSSQICKNFKLLRVLKIENFEINEGRLPIEIRTLTHLRFLSLEGSTFEEFPKTIGKLRFLQTLDLRVAEIIPKGVVVPNVLWKLKELRHLYLPICHQVPKEKDKLSLSGLNKLETLVNFDIEKVEIMSLEWKSIQHIDVRVHGKKSIFDVIDYIKRSGDKLKETFLHLSFSGFSYYESDVPIENVFNCCELNHLMVNWGRCDLNEFKVPSPFPSNLIELCLIRCQIREDPMPILGKFPQLRKLVLGKKTFMGTCLKFDYDSFQALRHLKIENLMHLERLEIYNRSMRNLSYLEIIHCLKLKMIPSELVFLRKLSELKLRMPKMFNDRLRRQDENEGEDFKKVKYVPFIFLEDL